MNERERKGGRSKQKDAKKNEKSQTKSYCGKIVESGRDNYNKHINREKATTENVHPR